MLDFFNGWRSNRPPITSAPASPAALRPGVMCQRLVALSGEQP